MWSLFHFGRHYGSYLPHICTCMIDGTLLPWSFFSRWVYLVNLVHSSEAIRRNLYFGSFMFKIYSTVFIEYLFCFSSSLKKILSKLYDQQGAWTRDPDIESCMLYRLRQPGTPSTPIYWRPHHMLSIIQH